MKNVFTYLSLIAVFVLQSTICRQIEILHTIPNLLLVFVVCYCMYAEPIKATILSGVAGVLMDIFIARHLGMNAIMMMYLGLALSYVSSDYIRTNFFTVIICVCLSTFLYEGAFSFLTYFIFDKVNGRTMFIKILYEAIYNVVCSCALVWLCRYLAYDEVRSF